MIEQWIKEIKKECLPDMLGMILLHNGIVRATAKDGGKVQAMNLSYDKAKLGAAVRKYKKKDGIADIKAWINPAVWNPPASAGGGMRCNPREVALL